MASMDLRNDHMAPSDLIKARLRHQLDQEDIADLAALDHAQREGIEARQALYVVFDGDFIGNTPGIDQLWSVWILQRSDYPEWELDFGELRADLFLALQGWQMADDADALEYVPEESWMDLWDGVVVNKTSWRLPECRYLGF